MNEHPQEEWLTMAASTAGLYSIAQKLPSFKKTSKLSVAQTKEIIQWMLENDFLPKSYSNYRMDNSVIDQIYKEINESM